LGFIGMSWNAALAPAATGGSTRFVTIGHRSSSAGFQCASPHASAIPGKANARVTPVRRRRFDPVCGPLHSRFGVAPPPLSAVSKDESCLTDMDGDDNLSVTVDGSSDPRMTVISIRATNRPGILQLLKSTLEDLGLCVERTEVDMEGDMTSDVFFVTGDDGARVDDPYDMANIEQVLTVVLNAHFLKSSGFVRPVDGDKAHMNTDGSKPRQKDLLYSLMDNYIKNDVLSVQNSIVNHVEYTLGRSRYR
jgi:hypothetical protein|tara:strand:- start:1710 stop:2456 length:747 start_codon:yes stop_codon:yes gene_type:complete